MMMSTRKDIIQQIPVDRHEAQYGSDQEDDINRRDYVCPVFHDWALDGLARCGTIIIEVGTREDPGLVYTLDDRDVALLKATRRVDITAENTRKALRQIAAICSEEWRQHTPKQHVWVSLPCTGATNSAP